LNVWFLAYIKMIKCLLDILQLTRPKCVIHTLFIQQFSTKILSRVSENIFGNHITVVSKQEPLFLSHTYWKFS